MKRLKLTVTGVCLLIFGTQATGQQSQTFSLSNAQPQLGEQLTFSFTPQDAVQKYSATFYIFHPSGFNANDLDIVASNQGYTGTITLPDLSLIHI